MPSPNSRGDLTTERREPEIVAILVAQDEPHYRSTGTTIAVVEQHRLHRHSLLRFTLAVHATILPLNPALPRLPTHSHTREPMTSNFGIFILVVLAVAAIWLAWIWNRLVALRAAVRAAWASVDALLKRRANLIPNLVAVVKGAMEYESGTLERITAERTHASGAEKPAERAAIEEQLAGTVRQLFAVVERYPDLKANAQILSLQDELSSTETDIASARRYYNAVVRDFNILRETFPTVLVAAPLGFKPAEYFELSDEAERSVPSANLDRE